VWCPGQLFRSSVAESQKNPEVHICFEERSSRFRGSKTSRSWIALSGCGLDNRAIKVRSPAEARVFSSSPCVQTGSGAHPASYTIGTRGPFPGGKAQPGSDADHSPPV
jgi:hypothetical protein